MDLKFTVSAHVSRPVAEVFEAVVDPSSLSNYFTTAGAKGRLETGTTVIWEFEDFPGPFPVEVIEVVPNEKIVLKWEANEDDGRDEQGKPRNAGYKTTVTMTFKPIDGDSRTLVQLRALMMRTPSMVSSASMAAAASGVNCSPVLTCFTLPLETSLAAKRPSKREP